MSSKKNLRSFRYSDEVAAILHGFGPENTSVNDKFEQLVLHCNLVLPELNKKIDLRHKQLKEVEDELRELQKKVYDQRNIGRELDDVMTQCRRLKMRLSEINDKL